MKAIRIYADDTETETEDLFEYVSAEFGAHGLYDPEEAAHRAFAGDEHLVAIILLPEDDNPTTVYPSRADFAEGYGSEDEGAL